MNIRSAFHHDVLPIAALERAVFAGEAYPASFLYQAMDLWPDLVCLAEEDRRILGYALGAPALDAGVGWILSAAVDPEARGRGVGASLVEWLIARLHDAGLRRIVLTVHPENQAAVRLYRRLGFVAEEALPEYFGSGEPRLRMRLSRAATFQHE